MASLNRLKISLDISKLAAIFVIVSLIILRLGAQFHWPVFRFSCVLWPKLLAARTNGQFCTKNKIC